MQFTNPNADIFIPDGRAAADALARTTHLGIGAHHDDLEFMAFHGIVQGCTRPDCRFTGAVCTHGGGSARSGPFANHADTDMRAVRREEQRTAARIGKYSAVIQLDYPSADFLSEPAPGPVADLRNLLRATRPQTVYTHNPADKHPTHIGVLKTVLAALRQLPPAERPETLLGCEVWRDLDWLPDDDKVPLDVSGHEELARELNTVFASQIAGGKRYDLAIQGRRHANATFFDPHSVDACRSLCFALDLSPLMRDDHLTPAEFITPFLDRFREEVLRPFCREPGT